MSNIADTNNPPLSFFERLKTAKQVLVPRGRGRTIDDASLAAKSIMTGFLPMTRDWLEVYPREIHNHLSQEDFVKLVWDRFKRRHEVAHERARLLRKVLGNEILRVKQAQGDKLVSALSPEIDFAGCVGGSMHGADLKYMDVVAIHQRSGPLVAEPLGTPTTTDDGWKVYTDFSIQVSDGVFLDPNSVVELRYNAEKISEATESCPDVDMLWPTYEVHKIRHVESLKISPDGDEFIGVAMNRSKRKSGDDHIIDNIRGRIITRYNRDKYESQIRAAGKWEDLSLGAHYPDTLNPDFVWEDAYPDMDAALRKDAEAAVLNQEAFSPVRLREIRAGLPRRVLAEAE